MFARCMICLSVALSATPPAPAQSGGFAPPGAGFVFSPGARAIRPLVGALGSAHVGAPVVSDVNTASIAPGGKWAFVTTANGAGFLRSLGDAPAVYPADGVIDGVDRVAWSGDAGFAALYSSASGRLQRV